MKLDHDSDIARLGTWKSIYFRCRSAVNMRLCCLCLILIKIYLYLYQLAEKEVLYVVFFSFFCLLP